MQNLRKLKKLNEDKLKKSNNQTLMVRKINDKKNPIENPSLIKNSQDDIFVIRNLDENKVDLIGKQEELNSILKGVQQISIQKKQRQLYWSQYLTERQRQQQMFLQACFQGSVDYLKKIINTKIKLPIQPCLILNNQGKNGMHLAVLNGNLESAQIIQLLFQLKLDINCQTKNDCRTPLIVSSIIGNEKAVQKLLSLGANTKLFDVEKQTALDYALKYQHAKIIQVFKKHQNQNKKYIDKSSTSMKESNETGIICQKSNSQRLQIFQKSEIESFNFKDQPIQHIKKNSISLNDFKKISMLGKGAFGKVYLVQNKKNNKKYAMKCLEKCFILKQGAVRYAMTERKVLSTINHPFIVKLNYALQNSQELFLVMDFCGGGDLLRVLKCKGPMNQQTLRLYVCEIILGLQQLHRRQIIYRDLKPGNVVIDSQGHARLTDFGLSKQAAFSHSFCGSTAYLAPEMLSRKGHSKVMDWYLLGVLMYECFMGIPPYWDSKRQTFMLNVKSGRYKPLNSNASLQLHDCVKQLLNTNADKRLGAKGTQQIKRHPWFQGVIWKDVLERKVKMPQIEQIEGKPVKSIEFQEQEIVQNIIQQWEYNCEQ